MGASIGELKPPAKGKVGTLTCASHDPRLAGSRERRRKTSARACRPGSVQNEWTLLLSAWRRLTLFGSFNDGTGRDPGARWNRTSSDASAFIQSGWLPDAFGGGGGLYLGSGLSWQLADDQFFRDVANNWGDAGNDFKESTPNSPRILPPAFSDLPEIAAGFTATPPAPSISGIIDWVQIAAAAMQLAGATPPGHDRLYAQQGRYRQFRVRAPTRPPT